MRRIHRTGAIGAILTATALLAVSCGSGGGAETREGPVITIGAQDFGESSILAEIYAGALAAEGYPTAVQPLGGFRDLVLGSFEGGEINFTPEYAASMLEFLNGFAGEASGDAAATTERLRTYLGDRGLRALAPSSAVDTNAFVVTPETSETLGIATLSDLAAKGADLVLGGPPDCETNAFCIPGLQRVYGLDLSSGFVPLDAGAITVSALESGEIDVALLFSTSGVIADKGWVLLVDDRRMLAADNVVPVLTDELVEVYGEDLVALVDRVSAALSTAELTEMNRLFDIERRDPADIAAGWLVGEGFVEG